MEETDSAPTEIDVLRGELKALHEDSRRSTITKRIYGGLLALALMIIFVGGNALVAVNHAGNCRADALAEWADAVTRTLRGDQEPEHIHSLREEYHKC
jgi:hypothetical protein